MSTIKIFMNGCCGRMGRVINDMCSESDEFEIVAGGDISTSTDGLNFPVFSDPRECNVDFDAIIDFSNVNCIPNIIELARTRQKPLVCCTTGLTDVHIKLLMDASLSIPVFKSANMSVGMNVLLGLVRKATNLMYPGYDIEIVEAHHNRKLDAPSGTALMIADVISEETNNVMNYVYDRHSVSAKRESNEIGFSSIRGGNIVGEHDVMFIGPEETLTISHSAQSRSVFARGALSAAKFVKDKKPGLYSMQDMIN